MRTSRERRTLTEVEDIYSLGGGDGHAAAATCQPRRLHGLSMPGKELP